MKEPLVSIIIPVYNCEKYLKETFESVKNQTYTNWELIIIDDCSTDKSINIIEEYANKLSDKIKIIKLAENKGVSIARNTGIKEAKGKYIAYLDADDFWKPDKLEKQVNFMEKNDYYFTYTMYTYLKQNREKQLAYIPKKLNYEEALKNTAILTSTVMINIEKIDKKLLEMPNVKIGQDSATWWQILKTGVTAYGLEERLTLYRRRKNSLSNRKIKCLVGTWDLYRKIEKINLNKSIYYFSNYLYNAIKKRLV